MKTLLTFLGSIVLAQAAAAQSLPPDATNCPGGRCPIVRNRWQAFTPPEDAPQAPARELIARAKGFCRLRVLQQDRPQRLGTAVAAGQSPQTDKLVFLSAGHIFADIEDSHRIELWREGDWHPATLLAHDRSPDRAVLIAPVPLTTPTPAISQSSQPTGRAVMIGFPRGNRARAFVGQLAGAENELAWLRLQRASHFDYLIGTSGGGVYDQSGALIGIQSCTDARGTVSRIGYTPIAAWDELFVRLGWCPRNWGRGCDSPQLALPGCAPSAPRQTGCCECGGSGPPGPPGPPPTPEQIQQALAEYLADHPPQVDPQLIEQAVARALKSCQPPQVDLSPVHDRLEAIEKRLDVPFEVQLFNAGTKVGSPRSVRPHGGYLPLDVFGEIETPAGPQKGE